MNRLERLAYAAGRIVGAFEAPRVRAEATTTTIAPAGPAPYDSAGTGRRTLGWRPSLRGPNASTAPYLSVLRRQSRDRYRNDAYGGGAIDYRTAQLVGCGIWPKSMAKDATFRARVQGLFTQWAEQCDSDGVLDFGGLTTLIARGWQEAGEMFVRMRPRRREDGLVVPLQLQVNEPELVPETFERSLPNGNEIRFGIETNRIGARQAFHFYPVHPGDNNRRAVDESRLIRVPAWAVAHVYLPLRAGQLRGLPALFRTLLSLRDLDIGEDANLVRWQMGNMFMGWLTEAVPDADTSVDPITGAALQKDANDRAIFGMEPGALPRLRPGEKLEFNEPPEAGNTYEAFIRQQLRKIAVATNTPYHALTGDMAQVNDRTVRVILQDFRRSLEALQWQILIHQFCRPVWAEWFASAVLSGALEISTEVLTDPVRLADAMAVEWAPDRWGYINPVQDVQADREEVRAGFASRTLKVKQRGYDREDLDRQRAEENAADRALGLVSESDASATDGSGKRIDDTPAPDDPAAAPARDKEDVPA